MRELTADRIISLLEEPTEDGIPVYRRIMRRASIRSLIDALQQAASPLTRENVCDMLGERHAVRAVPTLVHALKDPSDGVRSAAADALAKIGKASAGPALFEALKTEEEDGTRQMMILALGAVGYVPAIPTLIGLLEDPAAKVRGCAAWSLGALRAKRATQRIEQSAERETSCFAQDHMREALRALARLEL
jgi:HEAT repeat protein